MALDDASVYIPGQGAVYFAPPGTPVPASLTAPASPWDNIGHTSVEDNFTITLDGGDTEVLGTWQNTALRERRDPQVYALTFHLLQVSNEVLALYFGGGDQSGTGVFKVSPTFTPQERALFVRIIDGSNEAALYVPKVSIGPDDDVEADIENFLSFPVRCTALGVSGGNLMEWYLSSLGGDVNEVQTITITGTPTGGTYTLTYSGQTTSAIPYNATATQVQAALRALSNIGEADVTCAGGPHPGTAVTATFTGNLAGTDVAQMTGTGSFTGGTSPAITITTTTPGG